MFSESDDQLVELVGMTEDVEETSSTREDVEGVTDGIEVFFGEVLKDAQGLGSVLGGLLILVVVGVWCVIKVSDEKGWLLLKLVCSKEVDVEAGDD